MSKLGSELAWPGAVYNQQIMLGTPGVLEISLIVEWRLNISGV